MKIVLFISPGVLGPFVFATLIKLKETVSLVVLPNSSHSVPATEILDLAKHTSIEVAVPKNLNDKEFLEKIEKIEPDIILVATFDKKLPKTLYSKAKIGAFNIHPSLLPAYKGACPEFWVLRNNEKITGITLHILSEEFDSGNIVIQEQLEIEPIDTVGSLVYKLSSLGAKVTMRFFDMLKNNSNIKGVPQKEGNYPTSPLVDANTLQINWNETTKSIFNLIRASNPIGGAWTRFRGFQVKIWHAIPFILEDTYMLKGILEIGNILILDDMKKIVVKTQDGFLEIKVIQHALYYILDGWDFAERAQIVAGETFN